MDTAEQIQQKIDDSQRKHVNSKTVFERYLNSLGLPNETERQFLGMRNVKGSTLYGAWLRRCRMDVFNYMYDAWLKTRQDSKE